MLPPTELQDLALSFLSGQESLSRRFYWFIPSLSSELCSNTTFPGRPSLPMLHEMAAPTRPLSLALLLLFITPWPICLTAYSVSPASHLLALFSTWHIYMFIFGLFGSPGIFTGLSIIYVINRDWPSTLPWPFSQSTKNYWAIFICQPLCCVSVTQKMQRHGFYFQEPLD